MYTIKTSLMKRPYKKTNTNQFTLFMIANLFLVSCGTYQSVYNDDGIYDGDTSSKRNNKDVVVVEKANENYDKKYFTHELERLDDLNDEAVFTNVDAYSSSDILYIEDDLKYNTNPSWGKNSNNDVVVNVHLMNASYWNDFGPVYNDWGYNNWGYNSYSCSNWGYRNNWRYNPFRNPYYNNFACGWGVNNGYYNAYYSGFSNPYGFHRFYNNRYDRSRRNTRRTAYNNTYRRDNLNSRTSAVTSRRTSSVSPNSSGNRRRRTTTTSPTRGYSNTSKNASSTRRSASNKESPSTRRGVSSRTRSSSSAPRSSSSNTSRRASNTSRKTSSRSSSSSRRRNN